MSVGSPIMCIECGYLHGHHAVSCERQRMTGEQLYQLMDSWVAGMMAEIEPTRRHKFKGAVIDGCCELIRTYVPAALALDFEEAMKRHGY